MTYKEPYRILCVCLGNICRSPTAEVVLRHAVEKNNLKIIVDSAGTSNYHIGDAPDSRSQLHAKKRGYHLSALRGRQLATRDFTKFDLILAMDEQNLHQIEKLKSIAEQEFGASALKAELAMMTREDRSQHNVAIADPYYGVGTGFEDVLDQCESASHAWVSYFQQHHIG
ncbi:low molecular weight protein-tyrosine-phosphatase [Acinetobacter nectaris]|uniref:low molecular weight protein-tyrosine-phosphatase n=1 Tax=Acinetobacter nectaris TaxID=1219382 RepID=UPI001F220059|nr:low molecular weight protein-tyrosine-phosphatase [Acinetobacter nectaris]MCF8999086.1 low molecular weight phosphotyrosine protein phosphatase [Acinetobacter nectaris]MCF9026536.1 low molecular weight phosphotyrosine protein phosphatase [Acinetobacter nectaris]